MKQPYFSLKGSKHQDTCEVDILLSAIWPWGLWTVWVLFPCKLIYCIVTEFCTGEAVGKWILLSYFPELLCRERLCWTSSLHQIVTPRVYPQPAMTSLSNLHGNKMRVQKIRYCVHTLQSLNLPYQQNVPFSDIQSFLVCPKSCYHDELSQPRFNQLTKHCNRWPGMTPRVWHEQLDNLSEQLNNFFKCGVSDKWGNGF